MFNCTYNPLTVRPLKCPKMVIIGLQVQISSWVNKYHEPPSMGPDTFRGLGFSFQDL